ncbi:DUF4955 domain-containing protein [Photobacterium sanctipauli]|uniref:DUF4955 domain-containing protein n=1 Tax=Photobacterium sanctipauli TaxID=1342794 RepID=A0A2T3NWY7_9GAMM|nr:DUF4955 domain-containing protein [Photobacterium sanctipauli]PSW20718.1 DUF4955 domain-containing protein [Photobacterium sanctipauli]
MRKDIKLISTFTKAVIISCFLTINQSNAEQNLKITVQNPVSENISQYWQVFINTRGEDGLYNESPDYDIEMVLPDFSFSGFKRGLDTYKLGDDPNATVFNVLDYGIVPDDQHSDKTKIKLLLKHIKNQQDAGIVDKAILYFPSGTYITNALSDLIDFHDADSASLTEDQPIFIESDNLVVKGDGIGETILLMTHHLLPVNPDQYWTTPYLFQVGKRVKENELSTTITSRSGPNTTYTITVSDSTGFSVGDNVEIKGLSTDIGKVVETISPYLLEHEPSEPGNYVWQNLVDGINKIEKHKIKSISGNELEFYTPVAHTIEDGFSWTLTSINSSQNVGFKDLTFAGSWDEVFEHHKNALHDSGYSLLEFNNINNSWVYNVEFKDFNQGLNLKNSFNVTAEDVLLTGNPGHMALSIMHSNNNLTVNVSDGASTWHAPGFSKYSISNVHSGLSFDQTSSPDLHGEQSMYNLFDRMVGGWVYGRWGASIANQPNHLKGLIFWNSENLTPTSAPFEFMRSTSEYGKIVMPYIIGMVGEPIEFETQRTYAQAMNEQQRADYSPLLPPIPQAHIESNGQYIYPLSLYHAQRELRRQSGQ